MYTVDRYHDISCGHRVHGHESKCAHLHGHNYRITFTCASKPDDKPRRKFIGMQQDMVNPELDGVGRVIDFSVIKATLCEFLEQEWDHKMLIWSKDPMLDELKKVDPAGVVAVPFNPTAENMAQYLVEVVGPQLLAGFDVQLITCRVEETRKCAATFSY